MRRIAAIETLVCLLQEAERNDTLLLMIMPEAGHISPLPVTWTFPVDVRIRSIER